MKRKIVVTEPMSTAFNFLDDIRARGYEPVILEAYIPHGYARRLMDEERKVKYARIQYPVTIIREKPDYSATLKQIRALDPLLVLVGGEEGVVVGTHLADDLGMTGNPYSNIPNMTQKSVMHDTLMKAGLRYIRGEEVASFEDCLLFLEKAGTEDVVLKHVHGVGSVGVHLVRGKEELLGAFREEETAENMFGEKDNRLILQECIFGDEYIVNTISRNGIPALTSIFRYYKKRMPSGAIIYRGLETVTQLNKKEAELVDYAFRTVRALGITDGPVHGEYMIDEKGPVLIEANCRVMGGSVPAGYLDRVLGHHETDVALDCMLDADFHREFSRREYHPLRKGYMKDFYSDSEKNISSSGIVPIIISLKSFHSGWVESAGRTDSIHETTDLETETGCIYLVHDDSEITKKEFDLLMMIEEEYQALLHSDGPVFIAPKNDEAMTPQIKKVLESDPEVLIRDILSYFRSGEKGENPVPQELLDADPYNREIMDVLKEIGRNWKSYSASIRE